MPRNPARIADDLGPESTKPFPVSAADLRTARLRTAQLVVSNDRRATDDDLREQLVELLLMLDLLPRGT